MLLRLLPRLPPMRLQPQKRPPMQHHLQQLLKLPRLLMLQMLSQQMMWQKFDLSVLHEGLMRLMLSL